MPTIILCKRANPVGGQGVIKLITQHVIVDWPPESPDNQYHLNK